MFNKMFIFFLSNVENKTQNTLIFINLVKK